MSEPGHCEHCLELEERVKQYKKTFDDLNNIIIFLKSKIVIEQHFRALWNRLYNELLEAQADE